MPNIDFLVLDEKIATFLRHAIDDTFGMGFSIETRPEAWILGREYPLSSEGVHASQILIKQETKPIGAFITGINRQILLKILNAKEPADQAMIDDATAELTNMLYGVFKTKVNGAGHKLAMGLPKSFHQPADAFVAFEDAEKLTLPFLADGRKCWVSIAQNR